MMIISLRTNKEGLALSLYYFIKRLSEKHYEHLTGTALRDALRQAIDAELAEGEKNDWYYQGLAMEARELQRRGIKDATQRQAVARVLEAAQGGFEGVSMVAPTVSIANPVSAANTVVTAPTAPAAPTPTFSQLMESFIAEKQTREGLRASTAKSYRTATKEFLSAFEALGIDSLPFDKMTRQNILQAQQWMIDTKGSKHSTINTYTRSVKTMIGWAALTYPEHTFMSPDKLMLKEDKQRDGKAIPPGVITQTLSKLQPVSVANPVNVANTRYWLTCLLAITGMRIGELLSLTKDDICHDASTDTHYINLTQDNGRVLKTPNAVRKIPLIDGAYGFNLKEFLGWVTTGGLSGVTGRYRQWLSKYHKGSGQSYTPHSYRHALATSMMNAGVPESHAAVIMGHAKGEGISYGLYASGGVELAVLRDALEKTHLGCDY
ncbi:tyrosine-type recombinase/integrase [Edwardsiella tarda]|uniref:tyrosine-type recombinase/integrase n=2 Tax=Edwardsiella tarda TaxID=636 RepID=UPI00351D996D